MSSEQIGQLGTMIMICWKDLFKEAKMISVGCPNYETSGINNDGEYDYEVMDMGLWEDKYYILFRVMACKEVHVALSDKEDVHHPDAKVKEVVIGGWDNTRSAIRYSLL